jgi:hypothetical protein
LFAVAFKKDAVLACWRARLGLGTFVPPTHLFEIHSKQRKCGDLIKKGIMAAFYRVVSWFLKGSYL